MVSSLCAVVLPLDIVWADPEANILKVKDSLERMPRGVDLVVLPELFSTGYIKDSGLLSNLPETNNGPTLSEIRKLAQKHNCAIAGSFLARTAHKVYNRAFFIEPNGEETFYDKRHLFTLSHENECYSPGMSLKPVVRFRGWDISMIVCYDLRFPVWCRQSEKKYDLLIVPANWGNKRRYAWEHLLIARAIENQAYVIGANRGGEDDYGEYDGSTFIYNFSGMPLGEPLAGVPGAIIATLDKEALEERREAFPVADSADRFEIIL